MCINKKYVLSFFCMMIVARASGAMKPQSTQNSSPSKIVNYLPTFKDVSDCVASSFDSLSATVTNTVSDTAAWQKLGWPKENIEAMAELKKTVDAYDKYFTQELPREERQTLFLFIDRREAYIKRALVALPGLPDGPEFGAHCLEHHQRVMNAFVIYDFKQFVVNKKEKLDSAVLSIKYEPSKKNGEEK